MSNTEGSSSVPSLRPSTSTNASSSESSTAAAGSSATGSSSSSVVTGGSYAGPNALATLLDTIRATVREEIQRQLPATPVTPGPSAPSVQGATDPPGAVVTETPTPVGIPGECGARIR